MKTRFLRSNILTIVIAAIVLAGCATPTVAPSVTPGPTLATTTPLPESVTITFWEWFGGARGEFFDREAELFHQQYPWITVNISHFSDSKVYRETLALAFESGDVPDVFTRRHPLNQLIDNNWIQPLDSWITPEWLSQFPEGSFLATRNMWEGKTYSFPTYTPIKNALFINEDLFSEAGLVDETGDTMTPQTWSDLRAMAKQISEAGNSDFYGIGIGIRDAGFMSWWFDLANLAGAPGPDNPDFRTGHYTYGSDAAYAQVVELLLGMKEDGSVYPYESTMDDSNLYSFFGQGKIAMFISGYWSVSNLKRDYPEFENYRVVPVPVPDEGRTGGFTVTPGQSFFFMSSQSLHPDEAWLWLDWISSRGFHERMVTQAGDFSIYPDLNTPQSISDLHTWQVYDAGAKYVVFEPFPPGRNPQTALVQPESVIPSVGDVLVGIYTGQIEDWQQALIDLETRKQTALETAIQEARDAGADVSLEDYVFPDWNPMENYVTQLER